VIVSHHSWLVGTQHVCILTDHPLRSAAVTPTAVHIGSIPLATPKCVPSTPASMLNFAFARAMSPSTHSMVRFNFFGRGGTLVLTKDGSAAQPSGAAEEDTLLVGAVDTQAAVPRRSQRLSNPKPSPVATPMTTPPQATRSLTDTDAGESVRACFQSRSCRWAPWLRLQGLAC
jgi:hypothetical protein